MNLTRYVNKKPKILMFTKISIYHHHQQQHLSVPALNSNCTLRVFETNGVSLSDVVAAPKKILKYERCWLLYMYAIEGSQKNLSCHSNCVVWTGAPLRLQCVTLASNRTITYLYYSENGSLFGSNYNSTISNAMSLIGDIPRGVPSRGN